MYCRCFTKKDRTMKKTIAALTLTTVALVGAGNADAQVTKMAGLWGVQPNYSSITPLAPADACGLLCTQIKYNNLTVASAVSAINAWEAVNSGGVDTHWTFSLSTDGQIRSIATGVYDPTDTYYLLGSPSTPGYSSNGYFLPTGDYSNVYFVVAQNDSVANPGPGSNLSCHVSCYNGIDLNAPTSSTVDPRTGAHVLYFAAPTTVRKTAAATTAPLAVEAVEATPTPKPLARVVKHVVKQAVTEHRQKVTQRAAQRQERASQRADHRAKRAEHQAARRHKKD